VVESASLVRFRSRRGASPRLKTFTETPRERRTQLVRRPWIDGAITVLGTWRARPPCPSSARRAIMRRLGARSKSGWRIRDRKRSRRTGPKAGEIAYRNSQMVRAESNQSDLQHDLPVGSWPPDHNRHRYEARRSTCNVRPTEEHEESELLVRLGSIQKRKVGEAPGPENASPREAATSGGDQELQTAAQCGPVRR
jgi:hypothetical protein